jgi:hypothetical protein
MSMRSFFGGVLIGLAIDLPPFLVNENSEFELPTLLLRWGVLAVSGLALYVVRPTRLRIRLPNQATASSQERSRQLYRPANQRAAASETDARSPASNQGN